MSNRAKSQPCGRPSGRKRSQNTRPPIAEMAERQKQKFELRRLATLRLRSCVANERPFLVDDLAYRLSDVMAMAGSPPAEERGTLLFAEPESIDPGAAQPKRKAAFGVDFDDECVRQDVANRDGIDIRSIRSLPLALQPLPIIVQIPRNRQFHLKVARRSCAPAQNWHAAAMP